MSLQAFGDSWELLMSTGEPVRQNKAEHPLWGYSCFLITYYKAASPPSLKLTVAQLVLDQIPPELPLYVSQSCVAAYQNHLLNQLICMRLTNAEGFIFLFWFHVSRSKLTHCTDVNN